MANDKFFKVKNGLEAPDLTLTDLANQASEATALVINGSNVVGTRELSSGAFNAAYSHPTFAGDDINIDTGALTGATVISDLDFNITTNTEGHVTDANASVATRTLTLADLGFTGDANANNYSHPTFAGDDINIDTGALTGATVISDLDFNVTTDTQGHVTDANASVATRTLTLANLGYTGSTTAQDGTVTSIGITAGSLIDVSGSPVTTSGNITVNVDLSELPDGTGAIVGTQDEIVYLDNGTQRRKQVNEWELGQFNNDQGWTDNTGTVTSVAIAGTDGIEVDSGSPITTSGTITLGLNTGTLETNINHDNLTGFVANEHIDWTSGTATGFHSRGIDDNTTESVLALSNAEVALTGSSTNFGITRNGKTDGILGVSAGSSITNGGNIVFYGSTHPSTPNDIRVRTDNTTVLLYDDSTSRWTFDNNTEVLIEDLAGTGDRMVVASSAGLLSTQAIPGGGGGVTIVHRTSAYTASNGEYVMADTGSSAFTVTLPASPSTDDYVKIGDAGGNSSTNNITVGRNGQTIDGTAADFVIDVDWGAVDFSFNGTTWKIVPTVV